MKRLLPTLLVFISFASTMSLLARLNVDPPSREWAEVVNLQSILSESFGQEQPFSSYLATMYYLDKLEERLVGAEKKKIRAALDETHCLLDALGLTTHALLTPVIYELVEDREGEVRIDKSNDHVITLYLLLKRAEGHLARKLKLYFDRDELLNDLTLQQLGQEPPAYVEHPEDYPGQHEKPNKFVSLLKKVLPPILVIGVPLIALKFYFMGKSSEDVRVYGNRIDGACNDVTKMRTECNAMNTQVSTQEKRLKTAQQSLEELTGKRKAKLELANTNLVKAELRWFISIFDETIEKVDSVDERVTNKTDLLLSKKNK